MYCSGSQTCSSRYPNQDMDHVLLPSKNFFAFQVEDFFCSDHSYYRTTVWMICFALPYPPPKNRILHFLGVIYPQFGNHWCIVLHQVLGWVLQKLTQSWKQFLIVVFAHFKSRLKWCVKSVLVITATNDFRKTTFNTMSKTMRCIFLVSTHFLKYKNPINLHLLRTKFESLLDKPMI